MKTKLGVRILALMAGVVLIVGLGGCSSIIRSSLHQVMIINPPQSLTVPTNFDATFSVYAVAGPPFSTNGVSYQWQFNGTQLNVTNLNLNFANLPGETNSSITITNAQTNNVGYYRVVVSGSSSVTSDPAALQVFTPLDGGIITVFGTPVASSGSKLPCPGNFAGYIKYTNNPPQGFWGWSVVTRNMAVSGADAGGSQAQDVGVQYLGYYGDNACSARSKSTPQPPLSPRYQFTIYFTSPVPTGNYPINLTNLQ